MSSYVISLFAISAAVAIAGYVSYGEKEDKTLKATLAVILIYIIASPTVELANKLFDSDFHKNTFIKPEFSFSDTDFHENAEKAFCDGICDFVCKEFSLSEQEVRAYAFGFDAKNMKAEKIKIILKGSAALADNRMISERIAREGLGDCEVELEF